MVWRIYWWSYHNFMIYFNFYLIVKIVIKIMFIHRTKRFVNLFRTIASPHYYFGIIKFHLPDLGEKIK